MNHFVFYCQSPHHNKCYLLVHHYEPGTYLSALCILYHSFCTTAKWVGATMIRKLRHGWIKSLTQGLQACNRTINEFKQFGPRDYLPSEHSTASQRWESINFSGDKTSVLHSYQSGQNCSVTYWSSWEGSVLGCQCNIKAWRVCLGDEGCGVTRWQGL